MGSTCVLPLLIWRLPRGGRFSGAAVRWRPRAGEQNQHRTDDVLVHRFLPVSDWDNPPPWHNHQFRPVQLQRHDIDRAHCGSRQQTLAAVPTRRARLAPHGSCEQRRRLPRVKTRSTQISVGCPGPATAPMLRTSHLPRPSRNPYAMPARSSGFHIRRGITKPSRRPTLSDCSFGTHRQTSSPRKDKDQGIPPLTSG